MWWAGFIARVLSSGTRKMWDLCSTRLEIIKTHHYIIFFVRPLHSKPGMERYCLPSTDQLSWWTYGIIISQVWPSCWLWEILIMVRCVLSHFKSSELYILSCEKCLGLYPIQKWRGRYRSWIHVLVSLINVPMPCDENMKYNLLLSLKVSR